MKREDKPNDSSDLHYQLHIKALDLFEAGEAAQGLEIVQQLMRLNPKDPHIDHIKGFLLSELGHQDDAIPLLRRAASLLPSKSVPRVTLGIAFMRKGDLAEAESILEEALAIGPDCFFSLTNLAACLLTTAKSPERAEQLLRKADLLLANDQCVWANLGRALSLQGKHAEADEALRHAIQFDSASKLAKLITDFYPHLAKGETATQPLDSSQTSVRQS